jgi:hypothetical protein
MGTAGRSAPLRRTGSLLGLLGAELAAVLALHWLGRFAGLRIRWDEPVPWLLSSPVQEVLGAVLRSVGLVMAYWLLASTVIYLLASLTRLPAAVRAVAWATFPLARRVADHAVAVTLATSMVGGTTLGVASPALAAGDRGGAGPPARKPVAAAQAAPVAAQDPPTSTYVPNPAGDSPPSDTQETTTPTPTPTTAPAPKPKGASPPAYVPNPAEQTPRSTPAPGPAQPTQSSETTKPPTTKKRSTTSAPSTEPPSSTKQPTATRRSTTSGSTTTSTTNTSGATTTTTGTTSSSSSSTTPTTTQPPTTTKPPTTTVAPTTTQAPTTSTAAPTTTTAGPGPGAVAPTTSTTGLRPPAYVFTPATPGPSKSGPPGGGARTPKDEGPGGGGETGPGQEATTHRVVRGDNLWTIAREHLAGLRIGGSGAPTNSEVAAYWLQVIKANQDTLRSGDPNLIYPGEKIALPPLE